MGLLKSLTGGSGGGGGGRAGVANEAAANYGPTTTSSPNSPVPQQSPLLSEKWTLDSAIGSLNQSTTALSTDLTSPLAVGAAPLLPTTQTHDAEQTDQQRSTSGGGAGGRTLLAKRNRTRSPATGEHDGRHESESPIDIHANDLPLSASAVPSSTGRSRTTRFFSAPWTGFVGSASTTSATTTCPNLSDTHAAPTPQSRTVSNPIPVLNASDVATSSSSVGLTSPVLRATDIPSRSSSMMTVGVSSSSSSSMTPPATLWPNVSPALSPPPSSILPLSSPSSMSSSLLVGSRREKSLPPLPLHPAVAAARGDLLNGPLPSPPPPPNGIIITPSSPNGKVATATAKAVSGVIYEEELEREERLASSPSNSLFGRLGMGMGKYATNQVVLGAVDGDEAGTTALSRQNTVRPTTNATSTSNLAPRSTSDEASRTRKIRHVRSLGLGLGKPKLAREPSELSTITLRPSAADEAKNMHGHRSFTEPMPPAPISLGQNRTTSESTLTVPDGRATEKKSGLDSPGLRMNPTGFHVGGASQSRSPSPTPSGRSIKFLADRAEDSQEEAAPRAGSSSLNRAASRKLPLRKARSFSDIFSSPHSSSLRQAMQDDAPRPDASVVASVQVDGQQAAASPQLPFSKANKPTSSSSTNLFKSAANLLKRKKKDKPPDGAGNDGKPRSTRIGSADGTDISSWPNSIAASPNPADSSSTLPSFTATPSVFSPSLEPTTAAIPISRNQPLSQLPEHSPMVAMTPEDYFTANFNLGTSQGSQMASFFGQSVDSPAMSPGVDDSNGGTRRSSTSDWSSSNLRRTQGSTEASIDGSTGVAEGYKRRNGSATSEFLAPRPPHLNLAQSDSHRRRANTDTAAQSLTPNSQDFGSLFDGNGLSKRPSLSRRSNSANSAVLGRVKTVLSSTSLGRTATMRRQQSADYMSSPNASTTSLVSAPLAASRQTSFDGTPNTSSSHRIGLGITTPARMSIASSISSFGADTRRHAEAEDRPSRRKRSSTMFSAPTSHFGSTPPISGTPPRKRPSTPQRLSTALFGSSPSHRDDSLFPLPPRGARSSLSVSEDERSRSQPPPTPSVKDLPEINADEDIEHWLMRLRAVVARSGLLSALTLRNDSHFQSARHLYIRKFDFKTDALDVALRRLLLESSLPKESQQIDRVIEAFARRYVECHPDLFLDPDHPYVIAFSLMMLHTDVFNKHNKSKMSKADYVRNTRMEGLPPVVLETFYDNIAYTPFRHMEDDSDLRSLSRPSTASRRKSILTDTAPPIATKSDIYQLIASGTTSSLRVDFADCDLDDDPISYSGTHTSLDFDNLRQQAITASSMDVDKPKQRRRSGATLLPGNKAGAVDRDETPTRLKLFKVGLLSRKEDLAEDGRKSVSRRWRSWSVILTGSQLLFLKDASWALVLLEQLESGTLGRLQGFKPEEVLNLDGTVAVHDRSYNKVGIKDPLKRYTTADPNFLILIIAYKHLPPALASWGANPVPGVRRKRNERMGLQDQLRFRLSYRWRTSPRRLRRRRLRQLESTRIDCSADRQGVQRDYGARWTGPGYRRSRIDGPSSTRAARGRPFAQPTNPRSSRVSSQAYSGPHRGIQSRTSSSGQATQGGGTCGTKPLHPHSVCKGIQRANRRHGPRARPANPPSSPRCRQIYLLDRGPQG